jgi:isocitrate dehydrogenase
MYWAEALAAQDEDSALKEQFAPLAKALSENEEQILSELVEIQGGPVDIGGYYHPDVDKTTAAMCPSKTLNEILAR